MVRPVASDDNEVLARLHLDTHLDVFDIATGHVIARPSLPRELRSSISNVIHIKWSPEVITTIHEELQVRRRWLLFVFSTRVAVLAIDFNSHGSTSSNNAMLLVDYQLETHLGEISLADFVISHEHVIVVFETATHVSMLSTTSPNRSDLPLPKYATANGLAQSPLRNSFALLTKSRGQENIAILTTSDGIVGQPQVFAAGTHDAQGLMWSPNGDPILAVWDTAAHGIQVLFFTALGHPLQKLKLTRPILTPDHVAPEIGVSCFTWCESPSHETIMAIGDGHGNIFVRAQKNREMISFALSQYEHSSTVDGSNYIVWQEHEHHTFVQQEIVLDLKFDPNTTIDELAFNSDRIYLSSKIRNFPKALWIWQIGRPTPVTVLIFHHDIRQVSWHPSIPHVLVVVTSCKKPIFFVWHDIQLPPQALNTGLPNTPPTSKWKADWLQNQHGARAPLMVSSTKSFDLGMLGRKQDHVVFESKLDHFPDGQEETLFLDTPSKPGRKGKGEHARNVGSMAAQDLSPATDDLW